MYTIGQNVVHSAHGVGIISGIEKREFAPNNVQEFYIMTIQDNGAPKKVFIPVNAVVSRLRPIMNKTTYNMMLLELVSPTEVSHQTWNMRYRTYMELMHSGSVIDIAKVIKALFSLKDEKDLSFGERKLLDQAINLLSNEIALFEGISQQKAEERLEYILKSA